MLVFDSSGRRGVRVAICRPFWVGFGGQMRVIAKTCRTAVEMSPFSAVEMSSFGPCSVVSEQRTKLFAEPADRVIARDFTIRFANRRWQIPEQEAQGLRPGTKVVVEQRLNGEIRFRTGDRYLAVLSLPRPARRARRKPPEHQEPSKVQTLRPASPRPNKEDHPWVTHHADPDTTIAGRARHRNGPFGKRNDKAPARAVLNSPAAR